MEGYNLAKLYVENKMDDAVQYMVESWKFMYSDRMALVNYFLKYKIFMQNIF